MRSMSERPLPVFGLSGTAHEMAVFEAKFQLLCTKRWHLGSKQPAKQAAPSCGAAGTRHFRDVD